MTSSSSSFPEYTKHTLAQTSAERHTPLGDLWNQLKNIEIAARECTGTAAKADFNTAHIGDFDSLDWALLSRMYNAKPTKHLSVYYHSLISFTITCPLHVGNQVLRHQIGTPDTAYTQRSLRYISLGKGDEPIAFHLPPGVSGTPVEVYVRDMFERQAIDYCVLRQHVKPEHARLALGVSVSTRIFKSFNIPALSKFLLERTHKTAQPEVQELANAMLDTLPARFVETFISK